MLALVRQKKVEHNISLGWFVYFLRLCANDTTCRAFVLIYICIYIYLRYFAMVLEWEEIWADGLHFWEISKNTFFISWQQSQNLYWALVLIGSTVIYFLSGLNWSNATQKIGTKQAICPLLRVAGWANWPNTDP